MRPAPMSWRDGDRLSHRFNPELGPGLVIGIEGRMLVVEFPESGDTLRLAADSNALVPVVLRPGSEVRIAASGRRGKVASLPAPDRVLLEDGEELDLDDVWPIDQGTDLLARLAAGAVDSLEAFAMRLDALRLAALREADGLGSFLGGRIRLFPHQLHVAERATRSDPVRWLLADEVGLGKTVESCLIANHLLYSRRAERALVIAPETLTVQWLGELWRKYHQVFVLLDGDRLRDVEKDFGSDWNPFEVHRRVVIARERLEAKPRLCEQAVAAGIDLLIVDEAHHLRRAPGHPGNPAYRAVQPITAAARHVLLLTAVPLEDDAHGFFRLLQLLRPDQLGDVASFESALRSGEGLPPCTSATRRIDIGGLPPRVAAAVDLDDGPGFAAHHRLVEAARGLAAEGRLATADKVRAIRRALLSPAAFADGALVRRHPELAELARSAMALDPRVEWLGERWPEWRRAGEKTLVFVAELPTLEALRGALSRRTEHRIGLFHEQLSSKQRDIEVAQFKQASGPSLLISTECGGEGRNFEFCTRLVLFDLPWNPMVVEQRIGRLDRIGRRSPVEIVYFRPPRGLGLSVARLYQRLGLFMHPLGSIETELKGVEAAIESLALASPYEQPGAGEAVDQEAVFDRLLEDAERAYDRVERAAYHELHREPYRQELGADLLSRVPAELERLTRDVVVAACGELGLQVEEHRAGSRHSIELDARARVESLPGLGGEASWLGTFFREQAVEDETLDFFATGHPLVEGLLAHIDEDPIGRLALLQVPAGDGERGYGLLALYKEGPVFEAVAIDASGRKRPDWAERLIRRPLESRRVRAQDWVEQASWPKLVESLGRHLEGRGSRPVALALFRIG